MQIVCPSCKTKFSFDEQKIGADGIKLRCGKCQGVFRVARKIPAPAAVKTAVPPAAAPPVGRIKVVVAHESAPFCAAVKKILAAEPFDVFTYNDGKEALAAIGELMPDVVLLDVALPSMFGFEVCEAVRKNPATETVKIILIASIYDKTRYKRSPQSLYGADDYIEKHHIPDSLAAMINRLVSGQKPVEEAPGEKAPVEEEGLASPQEYTRQEVAAQEAAREELKQDEERETSSAAIPVPTELPEAHVKARRLARIIVSDITLYNQGKVEEGVRNGTFYKLLADDIQEGRSLYMRRVPEDVQSSTSYLEDAFEELIAKIKRELSL
jgi:predicted Zn finger-like uncharacterized protein